MTFKAKSNPAEGPNPAGVATRLRRERDEARRRRDDLEITVKELRARLDREARLLDECSHAFAIAKQQDGYGLVPLNLMHKVHAYVYDCTAGYDPLLPEEPAEVE